MGIIYGFVMEPLTSLIFSANRRWNPYLCRDFCSQSCGGSSERGIGGKKKWWAQRESNPRPSGYEPEALPTEL